jgi:glycosyltransferase involved in cell wall biosynthesis
MRLTRPALLIFADDWDRHPSSCQHLTRRLRDDFRILWVNTIGTRRPQLNSFTVRRVLEKLSNWRRGLQQVDDQMWVLDLPMLPSFGRLTQNLNRQLAVRQLSATIQKLGMQHPIVLTTLPYLLNLVGKIPHKAIVYYVTDDYSHWPGADRDALLKADAVLAEQADLVLPVSQALLARYAHSRWCEYLPHGVDWNHFSSCQQQVPPAPLVNLPKPRIGFFGLIYEKLDAVLLSDVARHFHQGSLVMIGPVDYCEPGFASLPNVHLLGRQPYEQLPAWISGLDVLMLPYVDDEMIRQSGPLKLRECLATGKPTVSVDVPEVRSLQPHVRIGKSPADFIRQLEHALSGESPEVILARQQAVRDDDWDGRARRLRNWLDQLMNSRTAAQTRLTIE